MRGLLAESVRELNERQWVFFRYAILELVHSKQVRAVLKKELESNTHEDLVAIYREQLPELIQAIHSIRTHYVEAAVNADLKSSDFKYQTDMIRAAAKGEGVTEEELEARVAKYTNERKDAVVGRARKHLEASLSGVESPDMTLAGLSV